MIMTVSLCGGALCAFYYLREQYDYHIRKLPPGPTSIPFIGNALSIDPKSPHTSMLQLAKKYGDIFSIKLGLERVVVLNTTNIIKEAYKGLEIAHRPDMYSLDLLIGDKGFMTCKDHHQWKLHTKLCRNAMRVIGSTSMDTKVSMEADHLITAIYEHGSNPFDPQRDLYLASLNILCNISYGKRYSRDEPELHEILEYSNEILKVISPIHPVNVLPWLRHFPNKWFDALFKAKNQRDQLMMNKYVEHVATYKDGEIRDMMDALLAAARKAVEENDVDSLRLLTPDHIIINMWLIFFAGTDTVANTCQWGLLYMAAFPKKQAKLQNEMDRVLGSSERLTLQHKASLPYLEAVIYEILRHSSLALLGVPHAAAVDTNVRGYLIPKGTQVMANFWAVHHDKGSWEQPDEFLPERFLDENGKLRSLLEFPNFMPFSTGQRMCIGKNMAKAVLFLLMGRLLREFEFDMPDNVVADLEGEAAVSLIPKPYDIIATPRIHTDLKGGSCVSQTKAV